MCPFDVNSKHENRRHKKTTITVTVSFDHCDCAIIVTDKNTVYIIISFKVYIAVGISDQII